MPYRILAVNPGSTSTKIAIYEDENVFLAKNFEHRKEELDRFSNLTDQLPFRMSLILILLKEKGVDLSSLDCVVGRGGMLPPIETGGYIVNDAMKDCLINQPMVQHASNLGALIADGIGKPLHIPTYIYDAVVSDEMLPEAHITGFPEIRRISFCHVLNSRAMARKAAKEVGKRYEEMNYVVAHLGGGISISAHAKGKIIDSVPDDGGPFSPDRSGSVNLMYLVELCYSGKYTKDEILEKIRSKGGIKAHLGTHDLREVEKMIENGDEYAKLVFDAQALQIAKGIGVMLGVFEEKIDAVILTGGLAYSEALTSKVKKKLEHLVKVIVMPGENEMESLAFGGLRILRGEEKAKVFQYNI